MAILGASVLAAPGASSTEPVEVERATVEGPIPTTPPGAGGDRSAPGVEGTYPWFSTWVDLDGAGFVEEEFYVSGEADAFDPETGEVLAEDVPYRSRIIVRRPANDAHFNGTVLAEWQNVSAGYDLDALWGHRDIVRDGYAWVGISAQRVGVDHLADWSPARYGELDVTGGGAWQNDELSYDVFGQAAAALVAPGADGPLADLDVDTVLGIGASQSASRMVDYYDRVLPQTGSVFDGYAFVVGPAPETRRDEPVFHVLSETDVWIGLGGERAPDTDTYRRWEVAGAAHSGWNGQEYRLPLQERDNPAGVPEYDCAQEPFSRVPLHHVLAAAYDHLGGWAHGGAPPPTAEPIALDDTGEIVRDELGIAQGGIRLSQVEVPVALNDGTNSGETFCVLFGEHAPFDEATLDGLYRNHGEYVSTVAAVSNRNVEDGYIDRADAVANIREAASSGIGK
ncbi:MAG: alpha/beta hydrolase domain-containing protein [Actinomycetota bacterium]